MGTGRSVRFVSLAVVALAIVAGTATASASAGGAGCPASPRSSAPFAAWGDSTPYVLAPGGGVSLADGQSLTTDCIRVPNSEAIVRFLARATSGGGALHVELLVSGTAVDGGFLTATDTMGPLAQVVFPVALKSGNPELQVRLTAVGGSFDVGDVYIDPYVQKSTDL